MFRSAQSVTDTIVDLLIPFSDRIYSPTSNNGPEFAQHQEITQLLNLDFYFVPPNSA
jgi:IS30 family transposase